MKFSKLLLISLMMVLAGCASVNPSPSSFHALVGTYKGEVHSSGTDVPITTEIYTDKKGKIMGRYEIAEHSGVKVEGKLYRFHFYKLHEKKPYTLRATWEDKYGKGILRVLFSEDSSSFKGDWGFDEHSDWGEWNGQKVTIQE